MVTRRIYWISNEQNHRKIELWGSIGMSQESVKNPHTSNIIFAP